MRAERFWQDLLRKKGNVEMIFETNVTEIRGETRIDDIVLDKEYQGSNLLKTDGVFVEIGLTPNTEFLKTMGVELDEHGYVKVSADQSASLEGVFAAGDATTSSNHFRQIVTAASEGAIAANGILQRIQKGV
jgi:thioredoxin reductase